jgi:hypothetical protein
MDIPGKCQNETRSAPLDASDSWRKIRSLSRLRVRRQTESPTPFSSNRFILPQVRYGFVIANDLFRGEYLSVDKASEERS